MKKFKHLIVLFTLLALWQTAWAQTPTFSGGSGTEGSPYRINSQSDLNELAQYVNGTGDYSGNPHTCNGLYFEMTGDITVLGSSNNFTPIGSGSSGLGNDVFGGHFDGKGFIISGIRFSETNLNFANGGYGLFGNTNQNAVISNIILKNCEYIAYKYVGGIVGFNDGTIENCVVYNNVYIKGHDRNSEDRGGIVGYNNLHGVIRNCVSSVYIMSYSESAGGGTVEGYTYENMGGIAGYAQGTLQNNIVKDAHVPATLGYYTYYHGHSCGAIMGVQATGSFEHNYYRGGYTDGRETTSGMGVGNYSQNEVTENTRDLTTNDGAVYGYLVTLDASIIADVTEAGTLTHEGEPTYTYKATKAGNDVNLTYTGTVNTGYYAKFTVTKSYDETVTVNHNANNYQGYFVMPESNVTVSVAVVPIPWEGGGNSANDPYIIEYPSQWDLLATNVAAGTTYVNKFFRLDEDIEVSTMVGTSETNCFSGTFDGNTNTLTFNKGTSAERFDEEYCAPFRYVNDATVKNLHVNGTIYTMKQFAAGVMSYVKGTTAITNCRSSIIIDSDSDHDFYPECNHGSFVATIQSGITTIEGCVFDGSLLGPATDIDRNCGGFVGFTYLEYGAQITILNSLYAPASITISDINFYTFARYNPYYYNNPSDITITNCYYTQTFGTAQGKQIRYITAGTDVTVAMAGSATNYTVSGITDYANNYGLNYNSSLIAGDDDDVKLNLTYSGEVPEHFEVQFTPANKISGIGNPYTLDMPDADVEIGYQIVPVDWATENTGDSPEHAYMIYTKEQLDLLANRVNGTNGESQSDFTGKYFKLGDNIIYNPEETNNYIPIGNDLTNTFNGNFDGQGHTISGIRIDSYDAYQGLFGNVGSSANISNLLLYNTNISGSTNTGLIAGYTAGGATVNAYWRNCTLNNVAQNNVFVINSGSEYVTSPAQANISYNNVEYYANGITVTLTSTAPSCYILTNYTVTPTVGDPFDVDEEAGVYSFTLPASDITITANYQSHYWDGNGESDDPYIISDLTEWNYLVDNVAAGESYSGVYFKLDDDAYIEVNTMVGTEGHPFSGNFDGNRSNNAQLTLHLDFYGDIKNYVSPFRYVSGANIHNLYISGSVITGSGAGSNNSKYAASIVGHSEGTTILNNCVSEVDMNSQTHNNETYNGGLVGYVASGSTLNITNCVFKGSVDYSQSGYCSGFVGRNQGYTNINGAIYIPSSEPYLHDGWSYYNFVFGGTQTLTNCYYTEAMGSSTQGTEAYTEEQDELCHLISIAGESIYVSLDPMIQNVDNGYEYTGSAISINPTVRFGGETLDASNYTLSLTYEGNPATVVNAKGNYKYTATGNPDNGYYGSVDKNFAVVGFNGSGTENDPYLIESVDDWNNFATYVNEGYGSFNARYYKLAANNLEISDMVGISSNKFQGSFDGDGNTLIFNITANGNYCAPFRYVRGGTIKNLIITGTINTNYQCSGGFVADASNTTITNCVSSVNINNTKAVSGIGDASVGGFIGYAAGTTTITGCVFNGKLYTIVSEYSNRPNYSGGFVGRRQSGTPSITNCLYAPAALSSGQYEMKNIKTFVYYESGSVTINNSFYTQTYGDAQGKAIRNVTGGSSEDYTVTVDNVVLFGTSTLYDVSGITAYDNGGLNYNSTNYYGNGDKVKLTLSHTTSLTPSDDCHIIGYVASPGTLTGNANPYTLTMPNSDVTINMAEIEKPWDGDGSEGNPYIITCDNQWEILATQVNAGETFNGAYFQLDADLTITTMVGTSKTKSFQGTFDGNGNTLTLSGGEFGSSDSPTSTSVCAPFRFVAGTIIKNLIVAGDIYTSDQFAGGLIGTAGHGDNFIENCLSSVHIYASRPNNDGTHGGFLARLQGYNAQYCTTTFEGCAFTGSITSTTGTTNVGGFVGWSEWKNNNDDEKGYCTLIINNCFVKPNEDCISSGSMTFARCRNYEKLTINNGYYTQTIGGAQGQSVANDGTSAVGTATATYNVSGLTFYANGVEYSSNNSTTFFNNANVIAIEIAGYEEESGKWAFISSPVNGSIAVTSVGNLITNETSAPYSYDLFRYNPTVTSNQWENYVQHNDDDENPFNALENGYGYLYASKDTKVLTFTGTFNTGADDKSVDLEEGWNLVGNPFNTAAYINRNYYKMKDDGSDIEAVENNAAIPMCTGVVVNSSDGSSVTFTTTVPTPSSANDNGSLTMTLTRSDLRSDAVQDKAIVSFNEDSKLEKFIFNENNAKLYIPQDGNDYAIAYSDRRSEMPLHFKATETGTYTIVVETMCTSSLQGVRLIDKFENVTIDLGTDNEYTFTASSADRYDRFVLVFGNASENDIFAYQSGSDIIVTGEGELQVFDVMGRMVATQYINGIQTINTPQTGVYIFRLNGKTQKIVVK